MDDNPKQDLEAVHYRNDLNGRTIDAIVEDVLRLSSEEQEPKIEEIMAEHRQRAANGYQNGDEAPSVAQLNAIEAEIRRLVTERGKQT